MLLNHNNPPINETQNIKTQSIANTSDTLAPSDTEYIEE